MKSVVIFFSVLFLLSGCTSMNSNFDCPMKPGVRCESLDKVNEEVDQAQRNHQRFTKWKDSINYSYPANRSDSALRQPETIMAVWVAPFEDTQGNFHEANLIYTVAKHGFWKQAPIKEINKEDV